MDPSILSPTPNRDSWAPLIHRAKQLDPDAFDELVDALSPRLYGFLFRLTGRRQEAEELVQEVFLRIVRRIGQYEHDGRFEPWIFRIAANVVRDRQRHERRHPPHMSLEGEFDDGSTTRGRRIDPAESNGSAPSAAIERDEVSDRLGQALQCLSEAEREVILLRHYSGMSFEEIAALMETPLGTALARSHRGLKKLREWMESPT
jgi:RNA polymerase sigma-70 factor (ECF subfamily)